MKCNLQSKIHIQAETEKVWSVLTRDSLVEQWICDDNSITVKSKLSESSISYTGTFHRILIEDHAIIRKVVPFQRYLYSYWSKLSRLPNLEENYSDIEFILKKRGKNTILELKHSNIPTEVMQKHYKFYWNVALDRIKMISESLF